MLLDAGCRGPDSESFFDVFSSPASIDSMAFGLVSFK
jgi:hypothetical protein